MPIQLTKNLNTGISTGYFKLARLVCNALTGISVVHVNLYLSKAAFDSSNAPVDQFVFDLPLDITQSAGVMNAIQNQLKALPFFSGGADAS